LRKKAVLRQKLASLHPAESVAVLRRCLIFKSLQLSGKQQKNAKGRLAPRFRPLSRISRQELTGPALKSERPERRKGGGCAVFRVLSDKTDS
jgi:hypothetical protein